MNTHPELEKCQTFINCQLQPPPLLINQERRRPAVTISSQSGCDAHVIATQLANYLQTVGPKDSVPWTIFDRNLVEKVLEDHNLPQRLARFMPEDRISEFADILDELFGLHPPSWILVRQTAETILHLAELGNVILLGRGANLITRRLESVFNVRLVGSLGRRLERIQERDQLDRAAALKFIRRQDSGRERYAQKYFKQHPNDPLLYHLVINTDVVNCDEAAHLIGEAVLKKYFLGARSRGKAA